MAYSRKLFETVEDLLPAGEQLRQSVGSNILAVARETPRTEDDPLTTSITEYMYLTVHLTLVVSPHSICSASSIEPRCLGSYTLQLPDWTATARKDLSMATGTSLTQSPIHLCCGDANGSTGGRKMGSFCRGNTPLRPHISRQSSVSSWPYLRRINLTTWT